MLKYNQYILKDGTLITFDLYRINLIEYNLALKLK